MNFSEVQMKNNLVVAKQLLKAARTLLLAQKSSILLELDKKPRDKEILSSDIQNQFKLGEPAIPEGNMLATGSLNAWQEGTQNTPTGHLPVGEIAVILEKGEITPTIHVWWLEDNSNLKHIVEQHQAVLKEQKDIKNFVDNTLVHIVERLIKEKIAFVKSSN